MIQLSSLDNTFLLAEKSNLPMHVSAVSIYDPSTSPHGVVRFKDIMRLYHEAVYEVPALRRVLVEVPGKLDLPYWKEDPELVDIEFHVRHLALPQPGDWRQFYIQLSRLHSRALDMSRPPWEVYVIEGLNGLDGIAEGSFAVVLKLHHAAVDGDSIQRVLLSMHDFDPAQVREPKELPKLKVERQSSDFSMLATAYKNNLERPLKFGKMMMESYKSRKVLNEARDVGEVINSPEAGNAQFQGKISPNRVVTAARFRLSDFKTLRHAVKGATVNDMAISVIAGALRLYLEDKGDDLELPLIVQCPVNIRSESQAAETNNQISKMDISSCSDISDPLERLKAINKTSLSGKRELEITGQSTIEDMADALGPQVTESILTVIENTELLRSFTNMKASGPNFAFSNMPGPPIPVYLSGAMYSWGIGLGPLMPNMGLFITANSTMGQFVFGVTACRDMMPDPDFFQQCLIDSYEESKAVLTAVIEKAEKAKSAKKATTKKAATKKVATAKTRKS